MSGDSKLVERLGRVPIGQRRELLNRLRATSGHAASDLEPREWNRVVRLWNQTRVDRVPSTITDSFDDIVRRYPDHPAVADAGGSLTYRQLAAQAGRMADALRARGVGYESPVVLFASRGDRRALVAILAVLIAGGYWVPIDVTTPPARLAKMLTDIQPAVVVTDQRALPALQPMDAAGVFLLDEPVQPPGGAPPPPGDSDPGRRTGRRPNLPGQLAYGIYTSGTAGTPKAVLLQHASTVDHIRTVQRMFDLTPEDRFIQFASLAFDVSVFELFAALLTGACVWIPDDEERLPPHRLTETLIRERVSVVDISPAVLDLLDPNRLPGLRVAFVGGEAFTGDLTTRWARGRRFLNGYGPTECSVTMIAKECTGEWASSPPIGRPMDNHVAYVLDDRMRPVRTGVSGELYIGGAGLARGYAGRPALTAERFLPDPFATPPGTRLYRTGDLARWNDDGELDFLGRNDRQVQINGHRVELGEVECALAATPGVRQAVADTTVTGGRRHLVAYVVPEAGVPLDRRKLRGRLRATLPRYMWPQKIVDVPGIPLTRNGKLDLKALAALGREAVGEVARDGAPRHRSVDDVALSPTLRRLRDDCFSPVLPDTDVEPDDNFFELGGDSIQAIQMLSRVRDVFHVGIALSDFFATPTLDALAGAVDAATAPSRAATAVTDVLEELAALSDEEVTRMLAVRGELAERAAGRPGTQ